MLIYFETPFDKIIWLSCDNGHMLHMTSAFCHITHSGYPIQVLCDMKFISGWMRFQILSYILQNDWRGSSSSQWWYLLQVLIHKTAAYIPSYLFYYWPVMPITARVKILETSAALSALLWWCHAVCCEILNAGHSIESAWVLNSNLWLISC